MRLKNVKNARAIIEEGKYFNNDCFSNRGNWKAVFGNKNPIYIEIGMGKGKFIIENAIKYPNINFIGIEKYDSVLVRAIQKSNLVNINNLVLISLDANRIDEVFDREIDLIYLNFSDPWPKDRHSKRRLTSEVFLKKYDLIFKDKKWIKMKTDNVLLFNYSIDSLVNYGYKIKFKTNTLDCFSGDNIMTEYEVKNNSIGVNINMLEAVD